MKKLMTICAVVCLMLSLTCVSFASVVTPPPGAPSWWNSDAGNYAYAWWSADIIASGVSISPPDNASHWSSNYLANTSFTADISTQTIFVNLGNVFNANLHKDIYVYVTGTTVSTDQDIIASYNTDSGVFSGGSAWNINKDTGVWNYVLSGTITPQPEYVHLTLTVPGMTSVTNIWAGEQCIPEPATMSLLSIGALSLLRRKKLA
ncbi:MAG: PEP-CTERM sorting domain-containing protein [Phycisphaerae bacterium]|jgi:hypothetical protein